MKIKPSTFLVILLLPFSLLGTQLSDNFDDNSLNTNLWDVYLPEWQGVDFGPLSNASLTEDDGALWFDDGAILTALPSFVTPTIEGTFSFTNTWEYDRFKVLFRSDGYIDDHWQAPYGGIGIQFTLSSNPDYVDRVGNIQLRNFTVDGDENNAILASVDYPIVYNNYYDFKIVDDGDNVSLFMQNSLTPVLSFNTDLRYGDKVQFSNREFFMTKEAVDYTIGWDMPLVGDTYLTKLQNVVITSPEPSAFGLVLIGGLWAIFLRRFA